MISKTIMDAQADLKLKNAPNDDWRKRGKVSLSGQLKEIPITKWDKEKFGVATVGFYAFENPLIEKGEERYAFVGFILAVAKVKGKIVCETSVVIGSPEENKYKNTACAISHRFCPQCKTLDSVKTKTRWAGPECTEITYYCKCGYKNYDVMD